MMVMWLSIPPVPMAILPCAAYSTISFLDYISRRIVPAILNSRPRQDMIGRLLINYGDTACLLTSYIEIAVWFNVLLPVVRSQEGSWMTLCLYSGFLTVRFHGSPFLRIVCTKIVPSANSPDLDDRVSKPLQDADIEARGNDFGPHSEQRQEKDGSNKL